MNVSVLASGSKGNCTFVEMDGVRLIVDAGISVRRIRAGLADLSVAPSDIDAVLLTHEHRDHTAGLLPLLRATGARLYTRPATLAALGELPEGRAFPIHDRIHVGSVLVDAFSVPHDAASPVGFAITGSRRVVIATDIGYVTDEVQAAIDDADALIIEANHDTDMLMKGPYPWSLKQRILGRRGHLSNFDTALALARLRRLPERVFLAHLSETNNTPSVAESVVSDALASRGASGVKISVTSQSEMTLL